MRLAEKKLSANHFSRKSFRVDGLLGCAGAFALRKGLVEIGLGSRSGTRKRAFSCLAVGIVSVPQATWTTDFL